MVGCRAVSDTCLHGETTRAQTCYHGKTCMQDCAGCGVWRVTCGNRVLVCDMCCVARHMWPTP
eukprot:5201404-Prorocentrum_lima.AAC.1